jgi:hypothetical protein
MPIKGPVLAATCNYVCDGDHFVLVSGTAPEGYYCEEVIGECSIEDAGDTGTAAPIKIPVPIPTPSALAAPPAPQSQASYRFEPQTDAFYFAEASSATPSGKRYLGKISLKDLKVLFPDLGAAVEAKKAAQPGKGFTVTIPAVTRLMRPIAASPN